MSDISEKVQRLQHLFFDNLQSAVSLTERNIAGMLETEHRTNDDTYRGVTPVDEIFRFDSLRVYRYRGTTPTDGKTPLLLIPSMINKAYVMDLMPGSSLAAALREAGLPVYLLDWGTPGPQHDHLPFSFFIDDLITMACDAVVRDATCHQASDSSCRKNGCHKVSLLGYCMGGTMSLLHAALHPDRVARLTMLAAPVNFHDEGVLSQWARREVFDVDAISDTVGAMDPMMLQASFVLMKPLSSFQKYKGLYDSCADPRAATSFEHLERWVNDNVAVPREAYRQYVKMTYHENALINRTINLGGRPVDLKVPQMPILNVMARKDHIVPLASSQKLSDLVTAPVTDVVIDAGHIGVTMGRKAKEMFAAVAKFHNLEMVPSQCIISKERRPLQAIETE